MGKQEGYGTPDIAFLIGYRCNMLYLYHNDH